MIKNYDEIIANANASAFAKKIVSPINSQLTLPDVTSKTIPAMRFKQTNPTAPSPFVLPQVAKVSPYQLDEQPYQFALPKQDIVPYQAPVQNQEQPYQFALPKQEPYRLPVETPSIEPYSATQIAPYAVAPLELPPTPADPIKEISNFGKAVTQTNYKRLWEEMGVSVGNMIEGVIPLAINTAQLGFNAVMNNNVPTKSVLDTLHKATGIKGFDFEGILKSAVDPIKQKVYDNQQGRRNTVAQRYAGQSQSGFEKNLIGVSTGILDMTPMIAGNMILPGAGLAIMFGQVAESEYRTALKDGASEEQAQIYGILKGGIEVGTEALSGGLSLGGMEGIADVTGFKKWIASGIGGMAEQSLGRIATTELGKKFVSQSIDIFSEGAEEYISQVLGDAVVGVYKKPTKTLLESMNSQEAWDAWFMGSLTSAVMAGGAYASGKSLQAIAKTSKIATLSVEENLSIAQTLVKQFGADLVMIDVNDNRNGAFIPGKDGTNDTIYINEQSRRALGTVALHETGHLLINSAENGKEVVQNFLSIHYDGKSLQQDLTKLANKYQNFYDQQLVMDKHTMTKEELNALDDNAYADLVTSTVKKYEKERRVPTQDELFEEMFTETMEKVIDDASGMRRLMGKQTVADKIRLSLGKVGAKLAGDENALVVQQMQDIFNMYADGYKTAKQIEQKQMSDLTKQQMQPQTQLGRLLAQRNNVPTPQMASLAEETQNTSKITEESKQALEVLKTSQAKLPIESDKAYQERISKISDANERYKEIAKHDALKPLESNFIETMQFRNAKGSEKGQLTDTIKEASKQFEEIKGIVETLPKPLNITTSKRSISTYLEYEIQDFNKVSELLPNATKVDLQDVQGDMFTVRISDHEVGSAYSQDTGDVESYPKPDMDVILDSMRFSIEEDAKRKTPIEVKFVELEIPHSYEDVSSDWGKFKRSKIGNTEGIDAAKAEIMKDSKKLPTKEQWLMIAKMAGENLNAKNAKQLQNYAWHTWFDKEPSYKGNYNRQGEKQFAARFGVNEWIKAVYEGAGVIDKNPIIKRQWGDRPSFVDLTTDRVANIKQEIADRTKSDKEAQLSGMTQEQLKVLDASKNMTDAEREALLQQRADETAQYESQQQNIVDWMDQNMDVSTPETFYKTEPAPEGVLPSSVDFMNDQKVNAKDIAVENSVILEAQQIEKEVKNKYPEVIEYLKKEEQLRTKIADEEINQKSDRQNKIDAIKAMNQQPQNARNITVAEPKIETRKHQQTIIESGVVPETMKSRVEKEMEAGKFEYESYSDKKALQHADTMLTQQGIDTEYSKFIAKVATGEQRITKGDIAIAERLIQELSKQKGQWRKVDELIQYLAIAGTEAGQTVQAMSLINKLGTYGQMMVLDKITKRIQSQYATNKGNMKKGKSITITIDETLKSNLLNTDPNDAEAIKKAVGAIQQNIADQIPPSFVDKVNAWRYLSMLGNFRTHARNVVGNATAVPLTWGRDAIGVVLEQALPKDQRTKAILLPSIIATKSGKEILNYAKENYAEMSKLMNHNSKYDMNTDIEQKKTIFKTVWLEKLRVLNFDWLEKEDAVFKKYHYVRTMAEYMTAKGITPTTITSEQVTEAQNHAISEALKMTYQDASAFASKLNQIERQGGTLTKIAMASIIPFKKTPVNILKRGLEFSPVSMITIVPAQFMEYRKGNITQAKLIDSISAGLTGTGIALLGAFLTEMGVVSIGSSDDEKKNKYDEMLGKQNFSINVGDMNFTIDWAIPTVMPLFVGAQIAKIVNNKGLSVFDPNVLQPALTSVFNPVFEMSMLQGLTGALKSYNQTGAGTVADIITNAAESYAGQFIPTLSGQIARIIDQTRRSNYAPKGSPITPVFESFLRRMANKVPLASFLNAPLVNAKGVELKQNDNIILRAFETLLSPAYSASTKASTEDKELIELFDLTKDSSVLPREAPKYFTKDGTKYILNNKEYADFAKTMGTTSYDLLKKLIQSNTYKVMPPDDRKNIVNDLYEYARSKSQSEYLSGKQVAITDKAYLKISSAEGYGVSAVDYTLARYAFNSLDGVIDKKRAFIAKLVDRGYNYEKVKYLLTSVGSYKITDADYTFLKSRISARK